MILDGFTKCFFNRPTTPNNAGIQHAPFHSESIRPLGKSRTFPAKSLAGKIDKILSWHGKHTISFMRKCQGIA